MNENKERPWGSHEPITPADTKSSDWGFGEPIIVTSTEEAVDKEDRQVVLDQFKKSLQEGLNDGRFRLTDLLSCLPQNSSVRIENGPDIIIEALITEAKKIIEQSSNQTEKESAITRNENVGGANSVINEGDFLHGMPLQYLSGINNGLFIPEFYNSRTRTQSVPGIFVSQVLPSALTSGASPSGIIENSHTSRYGLSADNITLVIDQAEANKINLRDGFVSNIRPDSVARVISVGVPITSIKGCIVNNENNIEQAKKIIVQLDVYIPLFDGAGNNLLSKEEYARLRE